VDITIEPYYHGLGGPLVIVGEPGAGKTTLLYELATLLGPKDESGPIPAPFGLSNWALKEEPLAEWMVTELRRITGSERRWPSPG
jgi:predicted NACHT family NTPase